MQAHTHKSREAPKEIHEAAQSINGWLTKNEGNLLYRLASEVSGRGVVVEVGSWQGKSTVYIGSALKKLPHPPQFYAVDPHVGSEEHQKPNQKVWTFDKFQKNIADANLEHVVSPIIEYSANFAATIDSPVELIFIDGAHDLLSVEQDIKSWLPKVLSGGVIAFHDTYAGGDPYRALKKHIYPSREVGLVCRMDSITYCKKVEKNSRLTQLLNLVSMKLEDVKIVIYKNNTAKRLVNILKSIKS